MLEQITDLSPATDWSSQFLAAANEEGNLLALHLAQRVELDSIQSELEGAADYIREDYKERAALISGIKARQRIAQARLQEIGYSLERCRDTQRVAAQMMQADSVRKLIEFTDRQEDHQKAVLDEMNTKHLDLMDRMVLAMEAVAKAVGPRS